MGGTDTQYASEGSLVFDPKGGSGRPFVARRFECSHLNEAIAPSGLRVHGLLVTAAEHLPEESTTSSEPTIAAFSGLLAEGVPSHGSSRQWLSFARPRSSCLIRSDIVSLRLTDAPWVDRVVEAISGSPGRQDAITGATGLWAAQEDVLTSSLVLLKPDVNASDPSLAVDLANRLSLPVLYPGVRQRRTVALVECGKSPHTALGIWNAARALDIQILAIDKPGHWISKPEYSDWHVGFVPVDRKPDAGFADRLFEAIKASNIHIDGLTTFFDPLFPGVAAAALKLGLGTAPVSAYEIASDKFRTSQFEGHAAVRVSSLEQAVSAVADHLSGLEYPVIVKPCSGWGSEGVFRCANRDELELNMSSIDFDRHGAEVVVERYCDGPEVDANFILCNGQLLWHEISDDFPKDADDVAGQTGLTFIEVANVLPSALPADEQEMLANELTQTLLRLGFRTGFFHLEARVDRSKARYSTDASGRLDLRPREQVASNEPAPAAWLIEINARPPGLQAAWASRATYGIDFWGVAFACALNDHDAIRGLAVPFATNNQYWMEIVFVPVPHGGLFESGDVCQELVERRPDLAGNVSRKLCFFKHGERVPDPSSGILAWVAYYLVYSRKSRGNCIEIAETIRRETRFRIVPELEPQTS